MAWIGIDLGTTNSCVARFLTNEVQFVEDISGRRTIPSCVAFTETRRLFGQEALTQTIINPENTIFEIKRLIGRNFDEKAVQKSRSVWPFQIVRDGNMPKILIQRADIKEIYSAESILSMLLNYMKDLAIKQWKKKISGAVISVPAYFNSNQRNSTMSAAKAAGLNVVAILDESTAAALAFGFPFDVTNKSNILVFDLGGGTCDVTVLNLEGGRISVKATAGDTHLGGIDFNLKLIDYCLDEFKNNCRLKNFYPDKLSMARLNEACEEAKIRLSKEMSVIVKVERFTRENDMHVTVSRELFQNLITEVIGKTTFLIERALADAGLNKEAIQHVILIGGSTRVPLVQKHVADYFTDCKLNKSMNPDETVAYGAAIRAAMAAENPTDILNYLNLQDVIPLTISVATAEDSCLHKIFPRNTRVPASTTMTFSIDKPSGKHVPFFIYEGERVRAVDNKHVGTFRCNPNSWSCKITLRFRVDENRALSVTHMVTTDMERKVEIIRQHDALSKQDVDNMIADAKRHAKEDKLELERLQLLVDFEMEVRKILRTERRQLVLLQNRDVIKQCERALDWISNNATTTVQQIKEKRLSFLQSVRWTR
ncbi:heat shock 70kDa protein 1/2/6/8 [Paragonimus westermani]|uniref:Heat shock 70kDa protein 1/2/6/8 n=1 Tax=Paragonimus westermani TaxID=34504 RepID=A0A5J4NAN5_9TREM|nr:heat shock 70kDa protein 1/2/6/8 [Paragonimus westermani]